MKKFLKGLLLVPAWPLIWIGLSSNPRGPCYERAQMLLSWWRR